ncbi:glycosyl hydrolase [Celeribacter neptunius]|uniref:Glycosyl hydrolase catalytic core n=1 Tax=Celeribacter neptunius TaxID=588602 RepID=A0A1I3NUX8_9RHOB|nr:glycosyl hydrolase [Celeribacter neptunius]SFJ13064.1 Glycosyl hydrolase catalytic core [Celeribacter neptunius]
MLRTLLLIGLMLMPGALFAGKAGIGAWENSDYTMLGWIEDTPALGWYYNWRPDQMWAEGRPRRSVEFVPMIHNRRDVNKRIVSDLRVSTLLGFNEPDAGASRGTPKMTVEEAVALWPKLERRGLRLGSPATLQSGTLGRNSWQRRFMTEVEKRGLRVDFMAVHYYSTSGSVKEFETWLKAVHAEYKRPIWVTEYAYVDWGRPGSASYAKNAAFAEAAMVMMEKLPFVERHAWFAANPDVENGRYPKINLVSDNLTPTPLGQTFDRVVSRLGGARVATRD